MEMQAITEYSHHRYFQRVFYRFKIDEMNMFYFVYHFVYQCSYMQDLGYVFNE